MSALTNFTGLPAEALAKAGPRTPEGKAVSLAGRSLGEGRSMKALKHGFSSRKFIVMPGQEEDFEKLKSDLLAEVRPEGALEEILFHQLLRDAWTTHRIELRQAEMAESGTAQRASSAPPNESESREFSSRTAAPFCACIVDPLFDPACEKEFDRIERYHARAQNGFHRAMRQLRTIQTNRIIQTVIPEPLGKGAFPVLVKPTEIVTLAKRTHKYWNAMAINTLISATKRSRKQFATEKEPTL